MLKWIKNIINILRFSTPICWTYPKCFESASNSNRWIYFNVATWCTSQKLSSYSNDGWSNYISDQELYWTGRNLTNDHLRNFIVHLRIVNFFFCLVYYLPDPTLHWAPTAFETNTPFWCTSLFFFLWRHQNDVMMTSPVPNVNLTSSVLPLAKIDNGVKYIAMFLLVRIILLSDWFTTLVHHKLCL